MPLTLLLLTDSSSAADLRFFSRRAAGAAEDTVGSDIEEGTDSTAPFISLASRVDCLVTVVEETAWDDRAAADRLEAALGCEWEWERSDEGLA